MHSSYTSIRMLAESNQQELLRSAPRPVVDAPVEMLPLRRYPLAAMRASLRHIFNRPIERAAPGSRSQPLSSTSASTLD